jgi:hypothetical protein
MGAKSPESESYVSPPRLPERIRPADLETLNPLLEALFTILRRARDLSLSNKRDGAVVAVHAVYGFLTRFEPVVAGRLQVPLMNLHSALLALDVNNIESILEPIKRTGRALSSPRRSALIGFAVGTAQQLEWTGLSPKDANKAVATKLNELGINQERRKGQISANTLRGWRQQINERRPLRSLSEVSAKDLGWINALINAYSLLTEEERAKLTGMAPAEARRFALESLEAAIREMDLA